MQKITLAIADDHPMMRKGVDITVKAFEHIDLIIKASNGRELIEKIKAQPPDVVLMDLRMPEMDGFETTTHLRANYPGMMILALSFFDEESTMAEFMKAGGNGYLTKEAGAKELKEAINTVMQTGYYFSDNVSKVILKNLSGDQQTNPELHGAADFTKRELKIIRMICNEHTTADIAKKLFLSPKTIEGYRKTILGKVGAKNTAGLAIYAMKNGLIMTG
ncbi:MAG: DNA-binding response regulator [Flavobacteriales bacterium]|nr:MAG: DNA-binding response regulator [Flavobacteriales bacterium]